jgi:hypothetical protein
VIAAASSDVGRSKLALQHTVQLDVGLVLHEPADEQVPPTTGQKSPRAATK